MIIGSGGANYTIGRGRERERERESTANSDDGYMKPFSESSSYGLGDRGCSLDISCLTQTCECTDLSFCYYLQIEYLTNLYKCMVLSVKKCL